MTLSSVSKSHRMTGWRCGWMVGPEALTRHLAKLNMCMNYGLPPFIQDATLFAIEFDSETSTMVRAKLDRNRGLFKEALSTMQSAKLYASGGGMFALLDVSPLGVSSRDFAWSLLERESVSVLPCDGFGESGRGLVRISLCESEALTREAARRIMNRVASC